jgi:hypothetical protein
MLENLTGSKIYVAVGAPAAFTVSAFKALAWAELVGVVTFGEWGDTLADVSEALVGEGRILHSNGVADGGEVAISLQHRSPDAGRDILDAAARDDVISFRKTYNVSGDHEMAYGVVSTGRQRAYGNDAIRGKTVVLRVNSTVLEATAAEYTAAV